MTQPKAKPKKQPMVELLGVLVIGAGIGTLMAFSIAFIIVRFAR